VRPRRPFHCKEICDDRTTTESSSAEGRDLTDSWFHADRAHLLWRRAVRFRTFSRAYLALWSVRFHGSASTTSSMVKRAVEWVPAVDFVYERDANTSVRGGEFTASSGPSTLFAVAPAIEHNWSNRVGMIVGARFVVTGRNTSLSVVPIAAINLLY
jgi:hypothetical protein